MRPNDAFFISDPTDRAFEACLGSHSWLETILLADRNARRGENSFTDEYYDRFYNQAAAILIRQLSDAATDVGSFWLTAWVKRRPAATAATNLSRMTPPLLSNRTAFLPKAELHLHLEGSIQPATVCALTARHGVVMNEEEVRRRYAYRNFPEFIEAFKWVTSFLREPQDYALIARDSPNICSRNV